LGHEKFAEAKTSGGKENERIEKIRSRDVRSQSG
jgi:hypothetical protein